MAKLKEFDDRKLRPSLNQRAANAFVRNAMFDLHADSSGSSGTNLEQLPPQSLKELVGVSIFETPKLKHMWLF
jgi:hypothetical protein